MVKRTPFTIQLTIDATEHVQEVTLGVDPGYEMVGVEGVTGDRVLYQGEVQLRCDVRKRMDQRRMYRWNRPSSTSAPSGTPMWKVKIIREDHSMVLRTLKPTFGIETDISVATARWA